MNRQNHHAFATSKKRTLRLLSLLLVAILPVTLLVFVGDLWKQSASCMAETSRACAMALAEAEKEKGGGDRTRLADDQDTLGIMSPRRMNVHEQPAEDKTLDFMIVGFPKCGTTSLLTTLRQHAEIAMPPEEVYLFRNTTATHDEIREQLHQVFGGAANRTLDRRRRRRGLKDPNEVYRNFPALRRLQAMTVASSSSPPVTRVVVALRHPVELFESYYNYRVKEWHEPSWMTRQGQIPPPALLLDHERDGWAGVHAKYLQMERYLAPLLELNRDQFPIFLLHLNQLKHNHSSRLGHELQQFLQLTQPVAPFVAVNTRNEKDQEYPQELDICRHDELRQTLIQQGNVTAAWLLQHFLPHAQPSNSPHLSEWIRQFGTDPCAT